MDPGAPQNCRVCYCLSNAVFDDGVLQQMTPAGTWQVCAAQVWRKLLVGRWLSAAKATSLAPPAPALCNWSPTSWSAAIIPSADKHCKDLLQRGPGCRLPQVAVLGLRDGLQGLVQGVTVSQYSAATCTTSLWLMAFKSWHQSFKSFVPLLQ